MGEVVMLGPEIANKVGITVDLPQNNLPVLDQENFMAEQSIILAVPPVSMIELHDYLIRIIPGRSHKWWRHEPFAFAKDAHWRMIKVYLNPQACEDHKVPDLREIKARELIYMGMIYSLLLGGFPIQEYVRCWDVTMDTRHGISWRVYIKTSGHLDVVAINLNNKPRFNPSNILIRDIDS
jgi:hypothetical protein